MGPTMDTTMDDGMMQVPSPPLICSAPRPQLALLPPPFPNGGRAFSEPTIWRMKSMSSGTVVPRHIVPEGGGGAMENREQ